jgi:hypothetical protein
VSCNGSSTEPAAVSEGLVVQHVGSSLVLSNLDTAAIFYTVVVDPDQHPTGFPLWVDPAVAPPIPPRQSHTLAYTDLIWYGPAAQVAVAYWWHRVERPAPAGPGADSMRVVTTHF